MNQPYGQSGPMPAAEGWYPDPWQQGRSRWWTGTEWSAPASQPDVFRPPPPPPVAAPVAARAVVDPARAALCRGLVIAGVVITFVGSLLPWATVDMFGATISVDGTSGDGVLTIIAAVLIAALGTAVSLGSIHEHRGALPRSRQAQLG